MLPIRAVSSASSQIEEAADWWLANRSSAASAFRDDLQQAFELISQQPGIGAAATNVGFQGVRRVFLGRLGYFLYYRTGPTHIEVLALWHASRGANPKI